MIFAPKRTGLPNQTQDAAETGSKTCTTAEPSRQGFSQIFSQEIDGNVYQARNTMNEEHNNTEENYCQLLQASAEGQQLSTIANTLSVMPGTEPLQSQLRSLSHKVDYLSHNAREMEIWKGRAKMLEHELKELRSVEDQEQTMLNAIVEQMRKNGSSMSHESNFRQLLNNFLKHMTVVDCDGKVVYDETNKLVLKK